MNIKSLLILLALPVLLTACNVLDGYRQEAGANGKFHGFKNARERGG